MLITSFLTYLPSFWNSLKDSAAYQNFFDITEETIVVPEVEVVDENGEEPEDAELIDIVEEELVIEETSPRIIRTLLTGLPSPSSYFWSYISFGINLALVLMAADHIWRIPTLYKEHELSFARVGYVADREAKILVREPRLEHLPLFVSYRYADKPAHEAGGYWLADSSWKSASTLQELDDGTDFTATVEIKGLRPDTRYQYALSNNKTGYFTTAPRLGQTSRNHPGKFTFVHSSCLLSRVPYNPLAHPLSLPGLRYLADWIPKLGAHFMVFLGDFIYIDVPIRLGSDISTYRQNYRQVYASPDWPAATKELPWIHVWDDHEIANDWDGNTTGVYRAAEDPWLHYHVSVNPPPVRDNATYFQFHQGLGSFFMMDTRRYRDPEFTKNSSDPTKTMLGTEQLNDLLAWLRKPEPQGVHWKILISSVPFTQNWHFGGVDTWGGYLGERQKILEAMWDVGLRGGVGVVVLSGDRHEFAATAFPPPKDGKWPLSATVHEFSTSPLSMFYLPLRTYKETGDDICIK